MDAGVQLGEALQQRGIVLDFQSRRAPGAAQSARGVHVAATSHQAVTVDLGRGQEFRLSEVMFLRALFTCSPLTAHEKSPQGSGFCNSLQKTHWLSPDLDRHFYKPENCNSPAQLNI